MKTTEELIIELDDMLNSIDPIHLEESTLEEELTEEEINNLIKW